VCGDKERGNSRWLNEKGNERDEDKWERRRREPFCVFHFFFLFSQL
jgi:hypothetical protein